MTARVDCGCGHVLEVDDALVGGITNCPRCKRAVEVPGLRDPFWRVLQVGALLVVVGAAAVVGHLGGAAWAVLTALVLAGLFWLVSRAL